MRPDDCISFSDAQLESARKNEVFYKESAHVAEQFQKDFPQ